MHIDAVAYSLPEHFAAKAFGNAGNHLAMLRAAVAKLGCRCICPHAGERLEVDELAVEIFFTQEDYLGEDINDLSMVFRISGGKKSVMFCGDAYHRSLRVVMQKYTAEQLHSDIVQAAHHALDGGDSEFYRMVGAVTVLAPMSRPAYDAMMTGQYSTADYTRPNRVLMQEAGALHLSADGDVCIPLDE